jgi:hypothetical protein
VSAPDPDTSPPTPRRRWGALRAVLLAAVVAAAWGWIAPRAWFSAAGCGFRLLTGAPCPGCGMTRAAGALARGEFVESLHLHPLAAAFAAAWGVALVLALAEARSGRPLLSGPWNRHGARWATYGLLALVVVWLGRVVLLPESLPDPIPPGSPAARLLGK